MDINKAPKPSQLGKPFFCTPTLLQKHMKQANTASIFGQPPCDSLYSNQPERRSVQRNGATMGSEFQLKGVSTIYYFILTTLLTNTYSNLLSYYKQVAEKKAKEHDGESHLFGTSVVAIRLSALRHERK